MAPSTSYAVLPVLTWLTLSPSSNHLFSGAPSFPLNLLCDPGSVDSLLQFQYLQVGVTMILSLPLMTFGSTEAALISSLFKFRERK